VQAAFTLFFDCYFIFESAPFLKTPLKLFQFTSNFYPEKESNNNKMQHRFKDKDLL
jgi:hypothetical protein